jgi:rod shape-determining protein MreD
LKERLQVLGLGLGLLLLQQLVNLASPVWARPDLVLAFALVLGLRARGTESLVLAFGVGYAVDVLSAAPLGLHALLRGTACAATRLFDRHLYLRAPLPWALFVAGYAVADAFGVALVLRSATDGPGLPWLDVIARAPLGALVTAIAAAPLLLLLQRIQSDAGRDEGLALLIGPPPRS